MRNDLTTRKYDWPELRDQWIDQNLLDRPSPYTLRMLARDNGIKSYQYVKNTAAQQKWSQQLDDVREKHARSVSRVLDTSKVFNEVEVRTRQAGFARRAQAKAMVALQEVQNLTTDQAIKLLQLGTQMELKALGFPDKYIYWGHEDENGIAPIMTPQRLQLILMKHLELNNQQAREGEPVVLVGESQERER